MRTNPLINHTDKTVKLEDTPTDGVNVAAWNRSVKCVALLCHWKLLRSYKMAFHLLALHQKWMRQAQFKTGNSLLAQLEAQLPQTHGPHIWACFHIGPYALLARTLIRRGHGVAILLRDEVFDEQYPQYIRQFEQNFGRQPTSDELQFVRSGNTRSLIHLKQLLEKGFHIICYIDGREGGSIQKGWTNIRLHNTPLQVRTGMAILSHWTGVPLYPLVMTTADDGKLHVHTTDRIGVRGKEDYQKAMTSCYRILEKLTAEELVQWELLPDLFDHIGPEGLTPAKNKPIWVPLDDPGKTLLFDLVSKRLVTVPTDGFRRLIRLRDRYLKDIDI